MYYVQAVCTVSLYNLFTFLERSLQLTSYILQLTSYILQLTSYNLHLTSYNLHLTTHSSSQTVRLKKWGYVYIKKILNEFITISETLKINVGGYAS